MASTYYQANGCLPSTVEIPGVKPAHGGKVQPAGGHTREMRPRDGSGRRLSYLSSLAWFMEMDLLLATAYDDEEEGDDDDEVA